MNKEEELQIAEETFNNWITGEGFPSYISLLTKVKVMKKWLDKMANFFATDQNANMEWVCIDQNKEKITKFDE